MTRNDIFSTLAILGTGALLAGCATVNADASEARSPEASRHGESNCASGSCGGKAAKHEAPAQDEVMEADAAPAAVGAEIAAPAAADVADATVALPAEEPAEEPAATSAAEAAAEEAAVVADADPATEPVPTPAPKKKAKKKKKKAKKSSAGEAACGEGTCA